MRSPSRPTPVRPVITAVVCCLVLFVMAYPGAAESSVNLPGKNLGWPFGQPSYTVPDGYHSHFALGQELMQSGDLEGAAREFLECIRLFEPYVAQRERQGDYQDTLMMEVYFRPLATACLNLGHALRSMDRLDTAIELFTGAADLAPGFVPAQEALGRALIEKGQNMRVKPTGESKLLSLPKPTEKELNLYRSAIAHLYVATQLEPDNAGVRVALSEGLRHWGVLDGALTHARRAVAIAPTDPNAQYTLGLAYAALGQSQAATDAYRQALKVSLSQPADFQAKVQNSLAQALSALGNFDDAVAAYKKAVSLDPKNAAYQNNLGAALRVVGKSQESTTPLAEATVLDPGGGVYHANLAAASMDIGQINEAIQSYRKVLRLDATDSKIHHQIGNALRQRGQLTNAINTCATVREMEITDDTVEGALALIAVHYLSGHRLSLVDAMDPRAYDVIPRLVFSPDRWAAMKAELRRQWANLDERPLYGTTRLELQRRILDFDAVEPVVVPLMTRFAKVIEVNAAGLNASVPLELPENLATMAAKDSSLAASIHSLSPETRRAIVGVSQVLRQLGDSREAIAELSWASRLDPKNAYVLVDWGLALMDAGDNVQALAKFRQAARLAPDMPQAHFNGGVALGRMGQVSQAVDAWQRAMDMGMNDAQINNFMGIARLQETELDYAFSMFRHAAQLDPGYAPSQYYLGIASALQLSASPITSAVLDDARLATRIGRGHYRVRGEFIKSDAFANAMQLIARADSLDPDRKLDYYATGVVLALHDPALSDNKGVDIVHMPTRIRGLELGWAEVTNNVAVCSVLKGDLDKAEALLRTAVEDEPDCAVAHWNLGRVLMAKKLEGEGLQELDTAARLARTQGLPYEFQIAPVMPAPAPIAAAPAGGITTPEGTAAAPAAAGSRGCGGWTPMDGLLEAFRAKAYF